MNSIYKEQGYRDRKDYLNSLAEEYDISIDIVYMVADLYGPNEDFDGLVTTLQDYAEGLL